MYFNVDSPMKENGSNDGKRKAFVYRRSVYARMVVISNNFTNTAAAKSNTT